MTLERGYWPVAVGLIVFGGAVRSSVSGLLVTIGVTIGWYAWRRTNELVSTRMAASCAVLVGSVGLISGVVRNPMASAVELVIWPAAGIAASLAVFHRPIRRRGAVDVSAVMLLAASGALLIQIGGSDSGIDVYLSHQAAADAIVRGDDPYGDTVLVPNTSPYVEDEVIVGYSYPPLTLGAFAASDLLSGDSRWMTVVSLAILLGVGVSRAGAHSLLLVFLVAPIWRYFVFSGWTEMLTLVLFVASAAFWGRSPRTSAILLGLALVSKQYLIVLLPVILAMRSDSKPQRLAWAALAGSAAMAPVFLWSPAGAFEALVVRPLSLGFRPDSQSLPGLLESLGLGFELPLIVLVGVVTAAGLLAAQDVRSGADLLIATGLVLSVAFLLGLAFPNYWLLVAGLVTFGVALRERDAKVKGTRILPISSG